MCGRFTLIDLSQFTDMFPWIRPPQSPPPPRYNIAPTQPIAAVRNQPEPAVEFLHWGLIPSWAKDPAIGSRMINARAETLDQKPAFRTALRRRRCIIPASGFFEWRKDPGGKAPLYITLKTGRPFAFAGLWDTWQDPARNEITSCTIITVAPNDLIAPIHDRMPAILRASDYKSWLLPGEHPENLKSLLIPYPAVEMAAHPVSKVVNSPTSEGTVCIEPVVAPPPASSEPRWPRRGADDSTGSLFT